MLIEHRYELCGPRPSPFALYGAISRQVPEAHGARWSISLCSQRRGFVVRGPMRAPIIDQIAVRSHRAIVRLAESVELLPARELWSPIVVIKLTQMPSNPVAFRSAIARHISERCTALGIEHAELGAERSVRVHGRGVRGFEVRARCSAAAAEALLVAGLGGKRSMGCGVFHDARSPWR